VPGDLRAADLRAGGLRAIVAEDQTLLRVGLIRILEAGGIDVVAAVDSADTLADGLTRDDFDVAIVDVRLPPTFTTEGLQTVVRARSTRPDLPVLILSQYVEPLYARELLAAGRLGGLPPQGSSRRRRWIPGRRPSGGGRRHRP
jgi:DNA-binding NarL/FixJ family response regulator